MTRTRIASGAAGFFDAKRIGARLEAARELFKVEPKTIATWLWPHRKPENARTDWYKKTSPAVPAKKFTTDEVDRVVVYFREHHGAPSLWPLIEWDEATLFDDFRALLAKKS